MRILFSPRTLRTFLAAATVSGLVAVVAIPASAADLKKLADELVNQSEQPAATTTTAGDLDGDGYGDAAAQGIEKSDIRSGMKVDEGNALNARETKGGQNLKEAPATRQDGDPIPDIDITVNQKAQ